MNNILMRFASAAVTDKGLSEKRPLNEDSYLELSERGLFAVADGVGGAQAGNVASQTAMEVLQEAFSNPPSEIDTEELLEMAIQRANASIYQMSRELPQLDMMATTIVAIRLEDNIATIGHVGDSRLYRLDGKGNLFRETQDHSMVEDEVRAGRMTAEQAVNHPNRNIISRALGADDAVEVDMKTIMFDGKTVFLLCSDGVTRHLSDEEIREILMTRTMPAEMCRRIKDICFQRGAGDNLTALIIKAERADMFSETDAQTVELTSVASSFNKSSLSDLDDESTVATARPTVTYSTALNRSAEAEAAFYERETADFGRTFPASRLPANPSENTPRNRDEAEFPLSVPYNTPNAPPNNAAFDNGSPAPPNSAPSNDSALNNAPSAASAVETKLGVNAADVSKESFFSANNDEKAQNSRTYVNNPHHDDYQSANSKKSRILLMLLLLLLGLGLGAGLHWIWANFIKSAPALVAAVPQDSPPDPALLEFNTFEKSRRNVDTTPAIAEQYPTDTASSLYLRARGAFISGNFDKAVAELKESVKLLPTAKDVNREMLRREINILANAVTSKTTGAKRSEAAAVAEETK